MIASPPRRRSDQGFTLLEMLVAVTVLSLLVILLASLNNQTLQIWRRTTGQSEAFQASRLAFETMIRQLSLATLNVYWDYDNANAPTRYLRKSDLAFVTGKSADLGVPNPGMGQALFFQAPMGRMDDPAARQLNLTLNTCGFYIDYGNANSGGPSFMNLPIRNRYRLMHLQTSGEKMQAFGDTSPMSPQNSWFTSQMPESRMLAENVVLLVVRPLAPGPGGTKVDLAGSNYSLDTRIGETASPQPATSNQLPPLLDVTMVAVSEDSMKRISASDGYTFTNTGLFSTPSLYDGDMETLEGILKAQKLDYRIFRQQIALPNSKWSD